ncbi:MAG: DUF262 domain-containing protein [Ruminococcus flavefaciens]|nr:DUF262 domain-containing protein [Ruminococcus flavefaciens]
MKLFDGEDLKLGKDRTIQNLKMSFEEITQKYHQGQIRIVTEQARYPLNTIVGLVESGNYILRPDFQRRHRWEGTRKSKLIESFIINVPVPPIFLYETTYSKYEVMDGLQRITAIYEFYHDKFKLEGLEEWSELNGYRYSELPEVIRLGIDRRYLSSIILLQETAKNEIEALNMKQLVFERLNSGGVDLSDQEARNALYDGNLNKLCLKLSKNTKFRKLFAIPLNVDKKDGGTGNILYDEMRDVELVLRYFAFRQIEKWTSSYIKKFLDEYLIMGNQYSGVTLKKLEKSFTETINLIYDTMGESAFRLWKATKNNNELKQVSKPTKVLYDSFMLAFCQYTECADKLLENKDDVFKEIKKLFVDKPELFISRFNKNDIINRRDEIIKAINKVIGE